MNNSNLLIILFKNPILGNVKTRLANDVGIYEALKIYNNLSAYTRAITKNIHCDKFLIYSHPLPERDEWEGEIYQKYYILGKNIGDIMQKSCKKGFDMGYEKVLMIGVDCPDLTSNLIEDAFNKLKKKDFVIGPARDGGYYLLGMKQLHKKLFLNKTWGSGTVYLQTIKDINLLKLTLEILPTLTDIDRYEDIQKIQNKSYYEYKHNYSNISRAREDR